MLFIEKKKFIVPENTKHTSYIKEFNYEVYNYSSFFLGIDDWDNFTKYMVKKRPDILLELEYLALKEEVMGKFLFSIAVDAENEAGAVQKFQDWNLNPTDMNIENLTDEDGNNNKYTVVGFYDDTDQKYAGEHYAKNSAVAQANAETLGVTVCGVFLGAHTALDERANINRISLKSLEKISKRLGFKNVGVL